MASENEQLTISAAQSVHKGLRENPSSMKWNSNVQAKGTIIFPVISSHHETAPSEELTGDAITRLQVGDMKPEFLDNHPAAVAA